MPPLRLSWPHISSYNFLLPTTLSTFFTEPVSGRRRAERTLPVPICGQAELMLSAGEATYWPIMV